VLSKVLTLYITPVIYSYLERFSEKWLLDISQDMMAKYALYLDAVIACFTGLLVNQTNPISNKKIRPETQ